MEGLAIQYTYNINYLSIEYWYIQEKILCKILQYCIEKPFCVHSRVYGNIVFQRKTLITFVINHQYYTIIKYFCREQWSDLQKNLVTWKKKKKSAHEIHYFEHETAWSFKKIWNLQILKTVQGKNFEYTCLVPSMIKI